MIEIKVLIRKLEGEYINGHKIKQMVFVDTLFFSMILT